MSQVLKVPVRCRKCRRRLQVFFVQVPVSARRLTILTMLDHWGAQVAGARCNCTCLRHSLVPRARAMLTRIS